MKRIAVVLIALLLVPLTSLEAAEPTSLTGSFPLGVYWPWERTPGLAKRNGLEKWAFVERCLDNLKAQGFDAVWAVNLGIDDLPGLAERMAARGMKLVPALGELHYNIAWRRNNWTYLEKESKRALAAAGASPSILAWALCDEPRRDLVGEMETFRQKFIEWGATQQAVVVTMWPDSPVYAEKANFGVVCTDIYPFFSAGNPNGPNTPQASRSWYRRQAQNTVQAAQKAGRMPWIMPQCFIEIWGPWKYNEHLDAVLLPGASSTGGSRPLEKYDGRSGAPLGWGCEGFSGPFTCRHLPINRRPSPTSARPFPLSWRQKRRHGPMAPAHCCGPTAPPRPSAWPWPSAGRAEAASAAAQGRRAGRIAIGRGLPARMDRRTCQPRVETHVRRRGER